MNRISLLTCTLGLFLTGFSVANGLPPTPTAPGEYTAIIEGYDWGPAVSRVVLPLDTMTTTADQSGYSVLVERQTDCGALPADQTSGERRVVYAYVSDARGRVQPEGKHVTLVMEVSPHDPLGSPIQYFQNERCRGNTWIDYRLTVTYGASDQTWNTEANRIRPLVAYGLGFKYPQHFSRMFKQQVGYSPNEYRQLN